MTRIKEPEFTLFPWQLLAIAVPLIAAGGAALAYAHQKPPDEVAQIFFAVLAAGNGYLLATAIGDFGRSMIIIPVGAFAAFIGVQLLQIPAARGLYIVGLTLLALKRAGEGFNHEPLKVILQIGLALLLMTGFFFGAINDQRGPNSISPTGMLLCYSLVWAVITASMPAENSFAGRREASETGLIASLYGFGYTSLGTFLGGAVASIIPTARSSDEIRIQVSLAIGLACGNYIVIKLLFRAAARVPGSPSEPAPVAMDDEELNDREQPLPETAPAETDPARPA